MFALFIIFCGAIHIMDIITIWNPEYGIHGFLKLFTAVISLATAILLIYLMPRALAFPDIKNLQEDSANLLKINEELRKNKDVELKKREEWLSSVVEATPNGLLMVNQVGGVVFCNKEFETLFGYQREEIIGRSMDFLVPERYRKSHPGHRGSFFASPQTRQMGAGRDLFALRKDGSEFPVEIGLNPLITENGRFVLASIVDITKRKSLEDRIRQSTSAVRQKNHEMEQFVYTVSHDLKSPLVTSAGFLGMIKEDIASKNYDKLGDSLMRLDRANIRMSQLINDLLQLSRMGRVKLQVELINMFTLVKNITENINQQIKDKSVQLIIQKSLHEISGDRHRIYQAIENLIINALKYACDVPNPKIEIGSKDMGHEIHFYIRDNGPGIAKEYHQKIFGLFQRLESDNRGTGVGLTIVSRAMQLHGGRVWIDSEIGAGATFWLAFPKDFTQPGEEEYEQ